MDIFENQFNFQALAVLAKCMGDANRLRILCTIGPAKKPVSRIVEELNLSQPLVSHHLKELRRALLVTVERNGPFVYYELADAGIMEILKNLDTLGRKLLSERTTF